MTADTDNTPPSNDKCSVKVVVRARPMHKSESSSIVQIPNGSTITLGPNSPTAVKSPGAGATVAGIPFSVSSAQALSKTFTFDRVYGIESEQCTLFNELGTDLLDNAFDGYHSCMFAYGQTGSGKSYSMMGANSHASAAESEHDGVIPRLCRELFARIDKIQAEDSSVRFEVEVSYMEIYQERVRDLLSSQPSSASDSARRTHHKSKSAGQQFRIREHPVDGPYVENLTKVGVQSSQELLHYVHQGSTKRSVAETAMNEVSSRSHAIFAISLRRIKFEADVGMSHERLSKISLVDLAGSERANVSKTQGERLREGSYINKSLTTLGLVIKALVERSRAEQSGTAIRKVFVPYRDSVLTWLLRESLGGNSKTIMLATLSPAAEHYEETLSTLRYAIRAKEIMNKAVVNEDGGLLKVISDLRSEVDRLKSRLAYFEGRETAEVSAPKKHESNEEVQKLKQELDSREHSMQELRSAWERRLSEAHEQFRTERSQLEQRLAESANNTPKRNLNLVSPIEQLVSFEPELEEPSTPKSPSTDLRFVPHIINLSQDDIADDAVFYLTSDRTRIGSDVSQDIVIRGDLIDPFHAVLELMEDGSVWLSASQPEDSDDESTLNAIDRDLLRIVPNDSRVNLTPRKAQIPAIYVNGDRLELLDRVQLRNGMRILLGRSHVFRFCHPKEVIDQRRTRGPSSRRESIMSLSSFVSLESGDSEIQDMGRRIEKSHSFKSVFSTTSSRSGSLRERGDLREFESTFARNDDEVQERTRASRPPFTGKMISMQEQSNSIVEEQASLLRRSSEPLSPTADTNPGQDPSVIPRRRSLSNLSAMTSVSMTPYLDKILSSPRSPTPQFSRIVSSIGIDIPDVEKIMSATERPYFVYHIYITLSHYETHAKNSQKERKR